MCSFNLKISSLDIYGLRTISIGFNYGRQPLFNFSLLVLKLRLDDLTEGGDYELQAWMRTEVNIRALPTTLT